MWLNNSMDFESRLSELVTEIAQLQKLMEPVVSGDTYFDAHTSLARQLISEGDPLSALDHIDALLAGCGALRAQPPCLGLSSNVSSVKDPGSWSPFTFEN